MFDFSEFKCPYIPKWQIHNHADVIRGKFWRSDRLPVNVELIIEKMGLDVYPKDVPYNIDAFLTKDLKTIILNKKRSNDPRFEARLRFSMAHELGHYVLHKKIIEDITFRSFDDYISFVLDHPDEQYSDFEYQANEFGGRLLVPYPALCAELDDVVGELQELGKDHMIRENPDIVLDSICAKVCRPFYVSQSCIERRIRNENLWPPEGYR